MELYVDFKELDTEDMPSNICNKYNLQVRSINGGSDYKNIQILSLTEHDKQVRKEVVEEIRNLIKDNSFLANEMLTGERLEVLSKYKMLDILIRVEDQIQGE